MVHISKSFNIRGATASHDRGANVSSFVQCAAFLKTQHGDPNQTKTTHIDFLIINLAFPWKQTHNQIKLSFISSPPTNQVKEFKKIEQHETILVQNNPLSPRVDFLCVSSLSVLGGPNRAPPKFIVPSEISAPSM